jgi:ABC-type thiamin/hydroxymethylpyrimidine transport system permease subunit
MFLFPREIAPAETHEMTALALTPIADDVVFGITTATRILAAIVADHAIAATVLAFFAAHRTAFADWTELLAEKEWPTIRTAGMIAGEFHH